MADRGRRSRGVSCSSSKSFTAICHSPAFSQAEMAALKQITSGDTCRAPKNFQNMVMRHCRNIGGVWSEVEHQQSWIFHWHIVCPLHARISQHKHDETSHSAKVSHIK